MEVTFKKLKGKEVYISENLFVPYSNNMQSYLDVEQIKIELNEKTGVYKVGVWNTDNIEYDLFMYSSCNSNSLKDTIEKIKRKI